LPLAGRRIGLDPGHGPRGDFGAVLVDPNTHKLILSEAEFNLDVALRCRELLRARGAAVVLTRETADTFTAPWPADVNGDGIVGGSRDDLQLRVDILNNFHAEVFLSIHANNAIDRAGRQGVQVLYCATSDCAFPAEGKRLGKLVLDQLQAKLAGVGYQVQKSRLINDLDVTYPGEPPGHMFVLGPVHPPLHVRATTMPGVISESLYVTSPEEAAQLNRDVVRQAIALAYADALQAYLRGSSK
jgi:N-acetylmuramoyl-L-alanine amidase